MATNVSLQDKILIRDTHCHPPKSDEFFVSQEIKTGIKRRLSNDPTERPQKTVDVLIKDVPISDLNNQMMSQFKFVAKRKKTQ